jgi:hypothetical protein
MAIDLGILINIGGQENNGTGDVQQAWATYRQQLRDIPAQAGFPGTINWPTAPTS